MAKDSVIVPWSWSGAFAAAFRKVAQSLIHVAFKDFLDFSQL